MGAGETTPLMGGGPGPPLLASVSRRLSALGSSHSALRRNSMRGTEHLVPAMGKLGSFLFLSNLITGACCMWRVIAGCRRCASALVALLGLLAWRSRCPCGAWRPHGWQLAARHAACEVPARRPRPHGGLGPESMPLCSARRCNANIPSVVAAPVGAAADALPRCSPQGPACWPSPPPTRHGCRGQLFARSALVPCRFV
jgi:hypothetical protein